MVGWAGGRGEGPDFFIYTAAEPAQHWSHDHTIWGELADAASLATVKVGDLCVYDIAVSDV